MLGRALLCGILGVALFLGIVYAFGLFPAIAQDGTQAQDDPGAPATSTPASVQATSPASKKPIGSELYAQLQQPANQAAPVRAVDAGGIAKDPIVISNCRLSALKKQEVPSQRDGVLLFIGTEIRPEDKGKYPPEQLFEVRSDNESKLFRMLKEGDRVEAGQLLAQVDDVLARAEQSIKSAKIKAADADIVAAEKTRDEALQRYETQKKLQTAGRMATSIEEVRGAQLTYYRYISETESKMQGKEVAQQEWNQARKTVSMYEVRAKIPGIIKTLYKRDGEAVKSLEPVVQIVNTDQLRVEGMVDVQYIRDLRKGMEVVIEPVNRDSPEQTFQGHRAEITAVAVSKDPLKPVIVSASDDGTVMVWDRASRRAVRVLKHPTAVKAVACTPPSATANLCLSGDASGQCRIWDLDSASETPLCEQKSKHRRPISCVAFSPDGKTCATASDDGIIMLWDAATGDARYTILDHRTIVTALQFTPLSELVSASRDYSIRLWKLGAEGAELKHNIRRASVDVAQVGVSPDGKAFLGEQGREMRIMSFPAGSTELILRNSSQASVFRTLAQFSPDSRMVLTASGSEGLLQLWRIHPIRSYELRQFLPGDRSGTTCASFAPNSAFVAGGTKDGKVYVWQMPSPDEVKQELKAVVTNLERSIESAESQVRITAEMQNPASRPLILGDIVTMVAYPTR